MLKTLLKFIDKKYVYLFLTAMKKNLKSEENFLPALDLHKYFCCCTDCFEKKTLSSLTYNVDMKLIEERSL